MGRIGYARAPACIPEGTSHAEHPRAPTLLRLRDVLKLCGLKQTSFYRAVALGEFTKLVRIGLRATAWPENEVAVINAARIAGKPGSFIRDLVKQLEANRSAALAAFDTTREAA